MKASWMAAALLGSVVTIACGDRTPQDSQNLEHNQPPAAVDPAGPAGSGRPAEAPPAARDTSPLRDGSAVAPRRNDTAAARPTTGERPPVSAVAPAPDTTARRADTAPAAPAPARWREVTLPAGTALPLELMTAVSSETAKVETPVRARLRQAVMVDGYTAVPAGAVLNGTVIDVARAGRVQGRSRLAFRFTDVELDGGREDLRTNPITFEGEQTKGEDATKIGAGAVGGAIIGGILGGGDGAAKGAAIGGAAGTGAVLATRGREVTLAVGTDLAASLATAFTVRAPAN
jgi:hypothetical protein